jgi:hypothetical protein
MRTVRQIIHYPSSRTHFLLFFLTDLHLGAAACDERLLKTHLNIIANTPQAYWILGGDALDCITRKDPRHEEEAYASWLWGKSDVVQHQLDYLFSLLDPIADRCLAVLKGNHEFQMLRYYDRDTYRAILRHLAERSHRKPEDLRLDTNGFLQLIFRRSTTGCHPHSWRFTMYCHHGYGSGRLQGGHALTLGRVLSRFDCDLALLGHRHIRQFVDMSVVGPNGRKRYRAAAFVPSYLDSYLENHESYAERAGYPATHLGTFPIQIKPEKRTFSLIFSN